MHRGIVIALCLLATSAQAQTGWEWTTYVEFYVWSPRPPGVPRSAAGGRSFAWYGDGIDAFATRSEVKIPAGQSLTAGTTFIMEWDPEEIELCPECKSGGYPTGWLLPTYMTLTEVPGWPFITLRVNTTQTAPATGPKYVILAQFWWLGTEPKGGSNDPDVWLDQLPPGGTNQFVSYSPLSPACLADTNGDGIVGIKDYIDVGTQWGQSCVFDYE